MDDFGRWIERAMYWMRSSYFARSILGGCISLIALVIAGIYFMFADQQL